MRDDLTIDEERANRDKLDFFFAEKMKCHIVLKRKTKQGQNVWLNGYVVKKLKESLYEFRDGMVGVVRLSLSEIADNGVEEFKGVRG